MKQHQGVQAEPTNVMRHEFRQRDRKHEIQPKMNFCLASGREAGVRSANSSPKGRKPVRVGSIATLRSGQGAGSDRGMEHAEGTAAPAEQQKRSTYFKSAIDYLTRYCSPRRKLGSPIKEEEETISGTGTSPRKGILKRERAEGAKKSIRFAQDLPPIVRGKTEVKEGTKSRLRNGELGSATTIYVTSEPQLRYASPGQ